jgi:electron transfer flavoprotein alpha subunit
VSNIVIDNNKCNGCLACIDICPFGAIDNKDGEININAGCKMCKLCLKACPQNAILLIEEERKQANKDEWKGIMVFVEHLEGEIHPVTYELIGKAIELAKKIKHPVYCLFIGSAIEEKAKSLLAYGVDKVFVYDYKALYHYRVDVYANIFEDCIKKIKPSIVLTGATSIGRSLAPRVSTRFRTGLTADCTVLDIRENTDLVQIRPAFGGNIMAQIITPRTRPQFATVRYKVMDEAVKSDIIGSIEKMDIPEQKLLSSINVRSIIKKEKEKSITDSDVLIVAGRGVKEEKDLSLLQELADLLKGQVAVTRPLVENGWISYTKQIGLSGRTVKPKLIITCGVSGAVQFTASMNSSLNIIAINDDKNAPIFNIAHHGIIGDLYEVIPLLIEKIKKEKKYAV